MLKSDMFKIKKTVLDKVKKKKQFARVIIIYFFTLKISTSTYEESKHKTSFAFSQHSFFLAVKKRI